MKEFARAATRFPIAPVSWKAASHESAAGWTPPIPGNTTVQNTAKKS